MQYNCNNTVPTASTSPLPGGGFHDHRRPLLDGVHHLKLPVSDLERARAWYESRLGYQVATEFAEHGMVTGLAMTHPRGGPMFALRLDPQRAKAAAGFDYFSIGVPPLTLGDAVKGCLHGLWGQGSGKVGVEVREGSLHGL
ncbi:VOC family protein [Amycolatopsis panacis]|uniref:VOC family protein n=1 Tax=Amycolatopsis panacis TaxID=2340917 RepID=UPI0018F3E30A|nr:VOC family protein [Amycolatopsis panacis]